MVFFFGRYKGLALFWSVMIMVHEQQHVAWVQGSQIEEEAAAILETLLGKIADDTLKFASHMEGVYADRCNAVAIAGCAASNYAGCHSEFPSSTCQVGNEWTVPVCTEAGSQCGALYDMTASTVFLPNGYDYKTTDAAVDDAICYSQLAEEYMIQEYNSNREFWADYNLLPPSMYYGADNGVFRIFPGRAQEFCEQYDPRIRPWFVGASSGPKDIVLVLDTSYSMRSFGRLEAMKEAAKRVVGTLGLQDYVSIVQFNTHAERLGEAPFLERATTENKAKLIDLVDNLEPQGQTDFYEAFRLAFDVLKESVKVNDVSSGCHQAVLFLTDGEMKSDFYTKTDLHNLIENERAAFASDGQSLPQIFTYSFGKDADESLPKDIACRTDGIWSRIADGEDLAASMSGYYKHFAYGLGDAANKGFVSWSEPYIFADSGHLGTTAAAPVYDRSSVPNLLIGVVGLDFTFAAIEKALGVEAAAGNNEIIRRLAARSVALCPTLDLSECSIQSLRSIGFGNNNDNKEQGNSPSLEGLCPGQCNDLNAAIKTEVCATQDHPENVWANWDSNGRKFAERTCCSVGETRVAGELTLEEIQASECVIEEPASGSYDNRTSMWKMSWACVGITMVAIMSSYLF